MLFSYFGENLQNMSKICFFCKSVKTVKNGHKFGKQQYLCRSCGRQFVDTRRLDDEKLKTEYIDGKQTLVQLSDKYNKSVRTIWNHLSNMRHIHVISPSKDVVILMDTTYWGRNFGLLIIKDAFRNKVLWYKFVRNETVFDYREGVTWLEEHGFKIYGIVCDGMRGLFQAFYRYPVQMCQFHMEMIVRRRLTLNPDLLASKELLALTKQLSILTGKEFRLRLNQWHDRWQTFISERSSDTKTGKSSYTHKQVRSAYLSLRYYMPYLWTYEKYPQFMIPKTNAGIESLNGRLKTMLRVHSGISKFRRMKLLQEYIARHY